MQCSAITRRGTQCINHALVGGDKCGLHGRRRGEEQCSIVLRNGSRCERGVIHGTDKCTLHRNLETREYREEQRREYGKYVKNAIVQVLEQRNINFQARPLTVDIGVRLFIDYGWNLEQVINYIVLQLDAVGDKELAVISRDAQNVHTAVVSDQTNRGLDTLFKFRVPAGQDTLYEIRQMFELPLAARREVFEDIRRWYMTSFCREEGDYLYRRVLDHAWAAIKSQSSEQRSELTRRLYQECLDSLGMCCDGHINRIVNAFVGFIDDIRPQVSVGEILQERMAEIADVEDVEERILRATAAFDELGINAEQAGPWLEALA